MQNENSVMRCGSCGLIALLALALSISGAAALDAGKIAAIRALPADRPSSHAELRRNRNSRRNDRPSGQSGADVVRFNGGTALIFDLY
jgi:hypothetical protein